ncbi:MAG: FtsQ-type POTRA domain-containing protein, partial [Alicyclobacillus sp.]|nr:FtsQ-type POTRA domain-containing protein [Alicyclobacillus sp.]
MAARAVPEDEDARRRRKRRNRALVIAFFIFVGLIVFLESPLTRVRTLAVRGNPSIPAARILKDAGLVKGLNMWQVNAAAVQRAVKQREPLVQAVSVHTDFIHGDVLLTIREKHVVAVLSSGGKFYWLLNDGTVFGQAKVASGLRWPLVTVDDGSQVFIGKPLENGFVSQLCTELAKTPDTDLEDVSEIHVCKFGIATVYM